MNGTKIKTFTNDIKVGEEYHLLRFVSLKNSELFSGWNVYKDVCQN